MAIRGFLIPSWLGWACGFLFLDSPWGPASFPSWRRLRVFPLILWASFVAIFQYMVYYEIVITIGVLTSDEGQNIGLEGVLAKAITQIRENPFFAYLYYFVFALNMAAGIGYRQAFIRKAKVLASLLNDIETLQGRITMTPQYRFRWALAYIGMTLSLLFIALHLLTFYVFLSEALSEVTVGSGLGLGRNRFVVLFVLLTANSTRYVAYSLIVSMTLGIGMIYEEVCSNFDFVLLDRLESIVKRLEKVEGSLLFFAIMAPVVIANSSVYNALINGDGMEEQSKIAVYFEALEQVVYILTLIGMGQCVKDRAKIRKRKLHRNIILKPNRPRTEVTMLHRLKSLDLKLKVGVLFDVDHKLFTKILSSSMSIIVCLFQFQLALQDIKMRHGHVNVTNMSTTTAGPTPCNGSIVYCEELFH